MKYEEESTASADEFIKELGVELDEIENKDSNDAQDNISELSFSDKLREAMLHDNVDAVKELISEAKRKNEFHKINECDKDGKPPLFYAMGLGEQSFLKQEEMLRILLREKIDIAVQDSDGSYLIHLAIKEDRMRSLRALLSSSASSEIPKEILYSPMDKIENTPLMNMLENSRFIELCGFFVQDATSANYYNSITKKTPLSLACMSERFSANDLEILLDSHIDINQKVDDGENTALMYAVALGRIDKARVLLSKKVIDVDHKNSKGASALKLAFIFSRYEIASLLMPLCDHEEVKEVRKFLKQKIFVMVEKFDTIKEGGKISDENYGLSISLDEATEKIHCKYITLCNVCGLDLLIYPLFFKEAKLSAYPIETFKDLITSGRLEKALKENQSIDLHRKNSTLTNDDKIEVEKMLALFDDIAPNDMPPIFPYKYRKLFFTFSEKEQQKLYILWLARMLVAKKYDVVQEFIGIEREVIRNILFETIDIGKYHQFLKSLVVNGKVNINMKIEGFSFLIKIVKLSSVDEGEMFFYFKENGVSMALDTKDNSGWSLLHFGCRYKADIKVLEYLIEQGLDVNACVNLVGIAPEGTPLILAVYYGYTDIVKYLIEHGADKNLSSKDGLKAIDYVRDSHNSEEIKKLLED